MLFCYSAFSGCVGTNQTEEYHIWNAIHTPVSKDRLISRQESLLDPTKKIRVSLQQSTDNYFNCFPISWSFRRSRLLVTLHRAEQGSVQVISQGFERRGVRIESLLLMRDPVERCWGGARMQSRNQCGQTEINEELVLAHSRLPAAEP